MGRFSLILRWSWLISEDVGMDKEFLRCRNGQIFIVPVETKIQMWKTKLLVLLVTVLKLNSASTPHTIWLCLCGSPSAQVTLFHFFHLQISPSASIPITGLPWIQKPDCESACRKHEQSGTLHQGHTWRLKLWNAQRFKDLESSRSVLRESERHLSRVSPGPRDNLLHWTHNPTWLLRAGCPWACLRSLLPQKIWTRYLKIFEGLPFSDSKLVSGKFWPTLIWPEILSVPSILNSQYHKTGIFMGCLNLEPPVCILQQTLFKEEFVKCIMHVCIFISCTNWSLEFIVKCSNTKS